MTSAEILMIRAKEEWMTFLPILRPAPRINAATAGLTPAKNLFRISLSPCEAKKMAKSKIIVKRAERYQAERQGPPGGLSVYSR